MATRILPWILESEKGNFRKTERIWRPKNLLVEPYRRQLLKDVLHRYNDLIGARDEILLLPGFSRYVKTLDRMKRSVQKAKVSWRYDDLLFFQALEDFYTSYGTILSMLLHAQAKGYFDDAE